MVYSSNIQNNSSSYQLNQATSPSAVNASNNGSTSSTSGFYKGQELSGEILDVKNNEVTVRLQDGRTLNARMEDSTSVSIGSKVSFRVEDVSNSNLTLKLIGDAANSSLDQILDKALDSAGISKSSRNKAIVGELLKQQMSIDKNTINQLIKQSHTFKDTPISTLVLLNKYQLPVTAENIKLFTEYTEKSHHIFQDIEDMASSIADLFHDSSLSDDVYLQESKNLLHTLFPNSDGAESTNPLLGKLGLSKESLMELEQTLKGTDNGVNQEHKALVDSIQNLLKNINFVRDGLLTSDGAKELLGLMKNSSLSLNQPNDQSHLVNELEQLLKNDLSNSSEANTIAKQSLEQIKNQEMSSKILDTSLHQNTLDTNTLSGTILQTELHNKNVESLKEALKGFPISNLDTITDGKELLSTLVEHLDSIPADTAKSILSSDDFKELLKEQLLSRWSLAPEDFADKELVDAHRMNLEKDIRNLSSFLEQTTLSNGAKAQGQASNLTDNLNFMNQLNHFLTYTQIPIRLNTGLTKSELYVYSKKKRALDNDSSVSVLLHLDMNYLGPLDIYLKLDKSKLDTNFYCDNNDIVNLISNHLDTLTSTLEEKGLQIRTSVQARNKTTNVIKEILQEETSDSFGIRYNFDVRA